jgi:hypothetical protein
MDRKQVGGVMNRIGIAAVVASLAGAVLLSGTCANGQSASAGVKLAQAAPQDPTAPPRVRRLPRLRVTPYEEEGVVPHYYPGPNAVRVCNAHYEQEYRPSGTVIVPKMHCYWTRDARARAVAD